MGRALPFGHPDRDPPRRGKRLPRKHTYTRVDFADVIGVSVANLGAELRRAGVGEPIPLVWLAKRLARRWFEVSRPLPDATAAEALGVSVDAWLGRWPLFDVRYCGFTGCSSLVYARGLCAEHAGCAPHAAVVDGYYCVNLEGRLVPFHRYVLPCLPGFGVVHLDGNRLNNRRENLEARPISSFVVGSPP